MGAIVSYMGKNGEHRSIAVQRGVLRSNERTAEFELYRELDGTIRGTVDMGDFRAKITCLPSDVQAALGQAFVGLRERCDAKSKAKNDR